MDLSYSGPYLEFRDTVRAFLAAHWDVAKSRDPAGGKDFIRQFRLAATEAGYLYRSVPRRYGGSGQAPDVLRAQIIREEFGRARAPMEVPGNGNMMLVPTLLECGSDWQKERFVAPTLRGEYIWAQGYSEPGSGSDLASVKTRGELVGEEWVINGQKIWTSLAHEANYMFALVRTEPGAPKHAGLSYLLLDFKQPGVTVRRLKQISGGREFCEVFLDDVRTPSHWLVGRRGEGWQVSRSTLKHERSAIGAAAGTVDLFDKLVKLARSVDLNGRPAIEDPVIRQRLAQVQGYVQSHLYSGYYQTTRAAREESAGILGLLNKLAMSNIGQDIAAIASDIIGDAYLSMPGWEGGRRGNEQWVNQIFGSLGMAIAGGTSNIQRNIISERGLELPREPVE
ncbi:MAG: acyl-CoA dehydrogenase family protein [Gammaproteobacteria bacterium]